jgi:hypothetical protein
MTTNQLVTQWGAVFGDEVLAAAILDRLLHHSHRLLIEGDSYRLKQKKKLAPQVGFGTANSERERGVAIPEDDMRSPTRLGELAPQAGLEQATLRLTA